MPQIFSQLISRDSVFVDANTLVYHFGLHPTFGAACNQLLSRIEQQDLIGYTSTHVLGELAHRLMMVEASTLPDAGRDRTRSHRRRCAVERGRFLAPRRRAPRPSPRRRKGAARSPFCWIWYHLMILYAKQ